jgi:hypothetical protein
MKYNYNLSDKIIAWLALLSGLTISAVAIWYSVAGLVSIFAAAVIPIIVMGVALEISKLIATVWLKLNWSRAPVFIRSYLLGAIAILMVITSMGIFGFLSKAHSDQSLVSGDVQAKISIYDEKIRTAKDNIDANRKALKQMDEAVDQVMGRSSDEKGADKAVQLRRSQQKERARLQSEIAAEQKTITAISEERAPIAAEVRKVEAEVGPIKYIAAFIYGDNPDANVLEKAVTWVIIIIVSVFDPLAVILLLASQYSFQWFRKEKETTEGDSPTSSESVDSPTVTPDTLPEAEERHNELDLAEEANSKLAEIEKESDIDSTLASIPEAEEPKFKLLPELQTELDKKDETIHDLEAWNKMIAEAEKAVDEEADHQILESVDDSEKAEMKAWKHDNPDSSLKHQRRLFERGTISRLPWEGYLQARPDFVNDAVVEAAKWAEENPETIEAIEAKEWANEQLDERPGDHLKSKDGLAYMENVEGQQVKKVIDGYQQNAEQNESTLWNRVKKAKE